MPRGHRIIRRPCSHVNQKEGPSDHLFWALSRSLCERRKCHGRPFTLRDDNMGLHQPRDASGKRGTLSPNEVYALTAFLLYKNDVIQEDEVMDAQSLPKVKMPNRDGFALPPLWKHGTPRLQGYP